MNIKKFELKILKWLHPLPQCYFQSSYSSPFSTLHPFRSDLLFWIALRYLAICSKYWSQVTKGRHGKKGLKLVLPLAPLLLNKWVLVLEFYNVKRNYQTNMIKLFSENYSQRLVVNYFSKKLHHRYIREYLICPCDLSTVKPPLLFTYG